MTIHNSIRRAGTFAGDGVRVEYPFAFKVFAESDVRAYVADVQGNETQLAHPQDYTVTFNPDQETHPGGTVRLTVALPVGHVMTLISAMPAIQPTEFTNQGGFYPRDLNNSFDRLTILVQQLEERVGRAMSAAVNAQSAPTLPLPKTGSVLRWGGNGQLVNDAFDLAALHAEIVALRVSIAGLGGQGALDLQNRLTVIETKLTQTQGDLRKVRILALAGL